MYGVRKHAWNRHTEKKVLCFVRRHLQNPKIQALLSLLRVLFPSFRVCQFEERQEGWMDGWMAYSCCVNVSWSGLELTVHQQRAC